MPAPTPPDGADPDCLFCRIVAHEVPAFVVHEDERTLAFMDINPATPGHALVVPRAHSRDLLSIPSEDLQACALASRRLAACMTEALACDGINLLNCCGADAWQSVFHFHLHVIPRYRDDPARDAMALPWSPTPGNMDEIKAIAGRLAV